MCVVVCVRVDGGVLQSAGLDAEAERARDEEALAEPQRDLFPCAQSRRLFLRGGQVYYKIDSEGGLGPEARGELQLGVAVREEREAAEYGGGCDADLDFRGGAGRERFCYR